MRKKCPYLEFFFPEFGVNMEISGVNLRIQLENSYLLCVKSVRIWNFFDPYFPEFGLNMEISGVNLRIQLECGKIRTRKTDTFCAVLSLLIIKVRLYKILSCVL